MSSQVRKAFLSLGTKKIDTLILLKDSELLIGKEGLIYSVKNLISDRAHISTYEKSVVPTTAADQAGEPGGHLRLELENAVGHLMINLRGRDAGKQTKRPVQPAKKPRGIDGDCKRHGCNGGNGENGEPAVDGFPGYDGGHSGSADVIIKNKTDLEVVFNYEPGRGSVGTAPSKPGLGGDGGKPDSIYVPGVPCPHLMATPSEIKCGGMQHVGKPGRAGLPGPEGVRGADGLDGLSLTSIFEIDGEAQQEVRSNWSSVRGSL